MDPLLQPYRLKHLTFRNRIMSTAHEPAYTEDGLPKERYRLYHAEKAKGGIALTMIGGSSVVSRDSPQAFGNIEIWRDEVVPWLAELADDVHSHGAAVMIQLTHLGRRTNWNKGPWLPVLAPSAVREPAHRAFPKAVEDWDIARIIADYADAAEKVKAAGFDGFEVYGSGHLLDQFWSPATNLRTDEWGGDRAGRLRFAKAVLQAVRDRVGPEFVVGMRLVLDEAWERGFDAEEGRHIAAELVATGHVDFLNVNRGHIDTDAALSQLIPGMGTPSAPHLDFAGTIRADTRMPVFHAARIQDVATARHAIASGKLDMVGMTRAHMADPHIALKIAAGDEHRIRPCVGMGYCIDSIYSGEAVCIHNPATGREASIPHVIARGPGGRRVLVVGAGPGGLEAARVAAERGHRVTLLEAAPEAGGQLKLAARLRRRRELLGIAEWRLAECARLGVKIRYDVLAGPDEVLETDPDLVILATGGLPNLSFLDAGAELATTTWDILSGAVRPAARVLLYDDNGAHEGLTTAEYLVAEGSSLDYVTPERILAPDVGGTNYPAYLRSLNRAGTSFTLNLRLERLERRGNALAATFLDEYAGTRIERLAEQVVIEHGTLPNDDLYFTLKPLSRNLGAVDHTALLGGRPQTLTPNPDGKFQLFRIGDAVSSRNIHAAIYDAIRLLKDL